MRGVKKCLRKSCRDVAIAAGMRARSQAPTDSRGEGAMTWMFDLVWPGCIAKEAQVKSRQAFPRHRGMVSDCAEDH